jgi:hypothetical protein
MPNPAEALVAFFSALHETDRAWLSLACNFQIDDEFVPIRSGDEALDWVSGFLAVNHRPLQKFTRLICLIAIIDFELSPQALARVTAEGRRLSENTADWVADQGRRMLQDTVPRMDRMIAKWADLRAHELDEAALWIYRDEQRRLELGLPGRPPGSPSGA